MSFYTDVVGKRFVGHCPYCYEAITLRYERSVEGLDVEYVRHEGRVCKAYQWHTLAEITDLQYEFYLKFDRA